MEEDGSTKIQAASMIRDSWGTEHKRKALSNMNHQPAENFMHILQRRAGNEINKYAAGGYLENREGLIKCMRGEWVDVNSEAVAAVVEWLNEKAKTATAPEEVCEGALLDGNAEGDGSTCIQFW
ncbi:hypothetical protein PIB30_050912 [Stylosanthes scabra]|uniref:Uncharacterized protein n=1 Tax=Stylosanthes scabra TaxID=79078 RepID=A0ABU6ZGG8_9FABA|nr:hypothetical protein [Stylosanthes scabra]